MRGAPLTAVDRWRVRFMRLACEVATWSKDPDRGVGAVVVTPDGRQFSAGYNGLPRGVDDSPDRLHDRDLKLALTVHAEVNAVINSPFDTRGCSLFTTCHPCVACACVIIQAGVVAVYYRRGPGDSTPEGSRSRWHFSWGQSFDLLSEAGVLVLRVDAQTA